MHNLPSAHDGDGDAFAVDNHRMEEEGSAAFDADSDVDAYLIQMKTLLSTTSTHDDWLHWGPYLHDIAFHTYAEYIDRVRIPRKPPPACQLFHFEPHYL